MSRTYCHSTWFSEGNLYPELFKFSTYCSYSKYKSHAEKKQKTRPNTKNDYTFSLTEEEFERYIKKPCTYCGLVPDRSQGEGGLDRIINKYGYMIGNITSACSTCNFLKSKFSEEEFYEKCVQVIKNCRSLSQSYNKTKVLSELQNSITTV